MPPSALLVFIGPSSVTPRVNANSFLVPQYASVPWVTNLWSTIRYNSQLIFQHVSYHRYNKEVRKCQNNIHIMQVNSFTRTTIGCAWTVGWAWSIVASGGGAEYLGWTKDARLCRTMLSNQLNYTHCQLDQVIMHVQPLIVNLLWDRNLINVHRRVLGNIMAITILTQHPFWQLKVQIWA